MGVDSFRTYAWGRTPKEAFVTARDRAQWEHGHGGYSGTIAEKGSFEVFVLPPRFTFAKLEELIDEADDGPLYLAEARQEVARAEARVVRVGSADKPAARREVRECQARVKRYERADAKLRRKAGVNYALVVRAARVYDDKWGPAVACEITHAGELARLRSRYPRPNGTGTRGVRLYAFCGMARC